MSQPVTTTLICCALLAPGALAAEPSATTAVATAGAPGSPPPGQGAIDARDWIAQAQAILKAQAAATPGKPLDYRKIECVRGMYYTIAYAFDGTCLMHAKSPKQVASNGLAEVDPNGRTYVADMIAIAKTSGEGWVEYRFLDTESKQQRTKCIYFQRVEGQDAVIGCVFFVLPVTPVLTERPKWVPPPTGDAGKARTFAPDLGLVMHWCPPGTFMLGRSATAAAQMPMVFDDEPLHQVTLTHGFWMGETEVTQGQWEAVMGSNPVAESSKRGDGMDALHLPAAVFRGANLPIVSITFDNCLEFCKKLTARERQAGRLSATAAYTLPTEAEWAYAAGAGGDLFFTGDFDTVAWYQSNAGTMLHPVAQKLPNSWGLYDVYGNAWEFCTDWYGSFPADRTVTDPVGPPSSKNRVIRGGGWDVPYWGGVDARRKGWPKDSTRYYVGFRLKCTEDFTSVPATATGPVSP